MNKFLFTGIFIIYAFSTFSQNANEILRKHDEVTYAPKDQKSELSIILTDRKGNTSTRKAVMYQKGQNMRLTRFTYPESQAGIGFLSLPNDVMYVYLPAFGNERRIASHVKNQTFAGTDFSYEDMESVPTSTKYNAKLVNTTASAYVLELTPKDVTKASYSKLVSHINKEHYYGIKTEYYNKGGVKIKELINTVEKRGNYWISVSAEMTDLTKSHKTKMVNSKVEFDTNLKDDFFTVRNLKNQ